MADISFTSKYMLIANSIRDMIIEGGVRVGERLKADTELAREYKVNKKTLANGMNVLVDEGWISRAPGRGTLVLRNSAEEKKKAKGAVGLITFSKGHVWRNMSQSITSNLLAEGLYPIFISEDILRPYNTRLIESFIDTLIADGIFGLIIDGEETIPFDFLRRNMRRIKNLVFVDHYQNSKRINNAKYVLVDYEEGGRNIARHFIANGSTLMTFFATKELTKIGYVGSPQQQMLKGIKDICLNQGVDFFDSIPNMLLAGGCLDDAAAILKGMVNESGGASVGVGCAYDSYAVNSVVPALKKAGLALSDEVIMSGFFNTPWAKEGGIVTFSIEESIVAGKAVDMLIGHSPLKNFTIDPKQVNPERRNLL